MFHVKQSKNKHTIWEDENRLRLPLDVFAAGGYQ